MINKANVVRLPVRSGDWSKEELAEFYRVENALIQSGLSIYTDRGITDEGDPWFIFVREHDDEPIIHFARLGSDYIIASSAYNNLAKGRNFHEMILDLLSRNMLNSDRANKSKTVFLHPSALLIIFVGIAYFQLPIPAEASESIASLRVQGEDHPLPPTNKSFVLLSKKNINSESPKNFSELETGQVSVLMQALVRYFSTFDPVESAQVMLAVAIGERSLTSSAYSSGLAPQDILFTGSFSKSEGKDSDLSTIELPVSEYGLKNIYSETIGLIKIINRIAFHHNSDTFDKVVQNENQTKLYDSYLIPHIISDFNEMVGASSHSASRNLREEGFELVKNKFFILLASHSKNSSEINETMEKDNWSSARVIADTSSGVSSKSWSAINGNLASEIIDRLKFNPYQFMNSTDIVDNDQTINLSEFEYNEKEYFREPLDFEFRSSVGFFNSVPISMVNSLGETLHFNYANISVHFNDTLMMVATDSNASSRSSYIQGKTESIYYPLLAPDAKIANQDSDFGISEHGGRLDEPNQTLRFQKIELVDDLTIPIDPISGDADLWMESYVVQLLDRFLSANKELFFSPLGEDGFTFQTKTGLEFGVNGKMLVNFYDGSFIEIMGQKNEILSLFDF